MEDDFAWLAAGLIFLGIIVQHDARAAIVLPTDPAVEDRAVITRPVLLWPEYLDAQNCRNARSDSVRELRPIAPLRINRGPLPVPDKCVDGPVRGRAILASLGARAQRVH
jgi:hypothetical protein